MQANCIRWCRHDEKITSPIDCLKSKLRFLSARVFFSKELTSHYELVLYHGCFYKHLISLKKRPDSEQLPESHTIFCVGESNFWPAAQQSIIQPLRQPYREFWHLQTLTVPTWFDCHTAVGTLYSWKNLDLLFPTLITFLFLRKNLQVFPKVFA